MKRLLYRNVKGTCAFIDLSNKRPCHPNLFVTGKLGCRFHRWKTRVLTLKSYFVYNKSLIANLIHLGRHEIYSTKGPVPQADE